MRISFQPQWVTAISAAVCACVMVMLLLTVWVSEAFQRAESPDPLADYAAALTIFNETLVELNRAKASGDKEWVAEMERRISNANKVTRETRLAFEQSLEEKTQLK